MKVLLNSHLILIIGFILNLIQYVKSAINCKTELPIGNTTINQNSIYCYILDGKEFSKKKFNIIQQQGDLSLYGYNCKESECFKIEEGTTMIEILDKYPLDKPTKFNEDIYFTLSFLPEEKYMIILNCINTPNLCYFYMYYSDTITESQPNHKLKNFIFNSQTFYYTVPFNTKNDTLTLNVFVENIVGGTIFKYKPPMSNIDSLTDDKPTVSILGNTEIYTYKFSTANITEAVFLMATEEFSYYSIYYNYDETIERNNKLIPKNQMENLLLIKEKEENLIFKNENKKLYFIEINCNIDCQFSLIENGNTTLYNNKHSRIMTEKTSSINLTIFQNYSDDLSISIFQKEISSTPTEILIPEGEDMRFYLYDLDVSKNEVEMNYLNLIYPIHYRQSEDHFIILKANTAFEGKISMKIYFDSQPYHSVKKILTLSSYETIIKDEIESYCSKQSSCFMKLEIAKILEESKDDSPVYINVFINSSSKRFIPIHFHSITYQKLFPNQVKYFKTYVSNTPQTSIDIFVKSFKNKVKKAKCLTKHSNDSLSYHDIIMKLNSLKEGDILLSENGTETDYELYFSLESESRFSAHKLMEDFSLILTSKIVNEPIKLNLGEVLYDTLDTDYERLILFDIKEINEYYQLIFTVNIASHLIIMLPDENITIVDEIIYLSKAFNFNYNYTSSNLLVKINPYEKGGEFQHRPHSFFNLVMNKVQSEEIIQNEENIIKDKIIQNPNSNGQFLCYFSKENDECLFYFSVDSFINDLEMSYFLNSEPLYANEVKLDMEVEIREKNEFEKIEAFPINAFSENNYKPTLKNSGNSPKIIIQNKRIMQNKQNYLLVKLKSNKEDQVIKFTISSYTIFDTVYILPNVYSTYYIPANSDIKFLTYDIGISDYSMFIINVEIKKFWGHGLIEYQLDEDNKKINYLESKYLISDNSDKDIEFNLKTDEKEMIVEINFYFKRKKQIPELNIQPTILYSPNIISFPFHFYFYYNNDIKLMINTKIVQKYFNSTEFDQIPNLIGEAYYLTGEELLQVQNNNFTFPKKSFGHSSKDKIVKVTSFSFDGEETKKKEDDKRYFVYIKLNIQNQGVVYSENLQLQIAYIARNSTYFPLQKEKYLYYFLEASKQNISSLIDLEYNKDKLLRVEMDPCYNDILNLTLTPIGDTKNISLNSYSVEYGRNVYYYQIDFTSDYSPAYAILTVNLIEKNIHGAKNYLYFLLKYGLVDKQIIIKGEQKLNIFLTNSENRITTKWDYPKDENSAEIPDVSYFYRAFLYNPENNQAQSSICANLYVASTEKEDEFTSVQISTTSAKTDIGSNLNKNIRVSSTAYFINENEEEFFLAYESKDEILKVNFANPFFFLIILYFLIFLGYPIYWIIIYVCLKNRKDKKLNGRISVLLRDENDGSILGGGNIFVEGSVWGGRIIPPGDLDSSLG